MSNLYRLVYTSFRNPECNDHEIKKILESCKKNNPGRNVTGVLIHSDSRFIQYIEGAENDVEDLFELIKKDSRHTAISRRNFEAIDKRVFPSWEMGFKDVSKNEIEFNTDITSEDKKTFDELIKGELDFTNSAMRLLQVFFKMQ